MKYDPALEKRVWDRVMGLPPAIPAVQIAEMANWLRESARIYHALGRRMARDRHVLQHLARDNARAAETFGAIYYVLTGKRVPWNRQKPQRIMDAAKTLRELHQQTLRREKDCEAFAQRGGDFAETFTETAQMLHRHAKTILRLLR